MQMIGNSLAKKVRKDKVISEVQVSGIAKAALEGATFELIEDSAKEEEDGLA